MLLHMDDFTNNSVIKIKLFIKLINHFIVHCFFLAFSGTDVEIFFTTKILAQLLIVSASFIPHEIYFTNRANVMMPFNRIFVIDKRNVHFYINIFMISDCDCSTCRTFSFPSSHRFSISTNS